MSEEIIYSNEHEYQFQAIKDTQKGILETQEQFDIRIKALEAYNIEAKLSNEALQKQQFELKALTLELDLRTNQKIDKQFSEVLASQAKMEIKTETQFEKAVIAREKTEDRTDVKFDKIILAQEKIEEKNNIRFQNVENGQNLILTQIIESQNIRESNKFELTLKRLSIILSSCGGTIAIILFLLQKFLG